MGRRGPKPSGKAITSTERSRKHRARAALMRADDYDERQAVHEACGVILGLLADEMRTVDLTSSLDFVLGHRTGLERAAVAVERYRASVRLEREEPTARVRFVA